MKWRRLGDTILWSAALAALREKFPDAEIDLALPAPYEDLFTADPRFYRRYALNENSPDAFVREWRERGYDLALGFHVSARSRKLLRAAGAKQTILHHHDRTPNEFGSDLRVVALGEPMSAIERDLNVARTIGWRGESPAPRLQPDPKWSEAARAAWPKTAGRPRVLLNPGASRPAKQWPLERFAALAEELATRAEVGVIFDKESAFRDHRRLREALARHARLVPTPRLRDAIGHLQLADAYAGSDSGIKHLAAALNVPTVTFFGPESVGEWHGYDEHSHRALQVAVGCRDRDAENPRYAWCGAEVCPLASHACLNLIGVTEAREALESLLAR